MRIARFSAGSLLALATLAGAGCGADTATLLAAPSGSAPSGSPTGRVVDELDVACDGSRTVVAQRTVAAGEAGVRVHVSGVGVGRGLYLAYSLPGPGSTWSPGGGEAVPTDGTLTLVLPPGLAQVACQPDGGDLTPAATVEVADPKGLYAHRGPLRDRLDCDDPGVASNAVEGRGSTAAAAAAQFAGFTHDHLGGQGAGYPAQSPQEFLAIRAGRATGTIQAFRDDDGSWTAGWNWVC